MIATGKPDRDIIKALAAKEPIFKTVVEDIEAEQGERAPAMFATMVRQLKLKGNLFEDNIRKEDYGYKHFKYEIQCLHI